MRKQPRNVERKFDKLKKKKKKKGKSKIVTTVRNGNIFLPKILEKSERNQKDNHLSDPK